MIRGWIERGSFLGMCRQLRRTRYLAKARRSHALEWLAGWLAEDLCGGFSKGSSYPNTFASQISTRNRKSSRKPRMLALRGQLTARPPCLRAGPSVAAS